METSSTFNYDFSLKMKFKEACVDGGGPPSSFSADGLYDVPAELRTGPGAARGDGREQGHTDDVVQGHAGRGSVCTREFHVEGVEWALYSARHLVKLVTSPTTIVVVLLNQVHLEIDLTNLLPQLDASTRSRLVWGTEAAHQLSHPEELHIEENTAVCKSPL